MRISDKIGEIEDYVSELIEIMPGDFKQYEDIKTKAACERYLLRENGNKDLKYVLHKIETRAIVYSQIIPERVGERLTENQSLILKHISENPHIPIVNLSKKIGITTKNIEVNIKKLKEKGLLRRTGPAKGGHWEVLE